MAALSRHAIRPSGFPGALLTPITAMVERIAIRAARMNSGSAIAGKMLRCVPTIAPTNALTTTGNEN